MLARTTTVLALCGALTLAACGGGDDDSSSSSRSASGGGSSGAGGSPEQTLKQMASALAGVKAFHIEGSTTGKDGKSTLAGDATSAGDVRVTMTDASGRFTLLVVDKQPYLKGDRKYWSGQGGNKVAAELADRWVKAPAELTTQIAKDIQQSTPKGLAYCATRGLGTLSSGGTQTLDGEKATVVEDAGDKPGSTPGQVFVATSGKPLPLRVKQTGASKPGGTRDPRCDDGDDDTVAQDVRFSRFDEDPKIAAPKDAIDLDALHAQGGPSTAA